MDNDIYTPIFDHFDTAKNEKHEIILRRENLCVSTRAECETLLESLHRNGSYDGFDECSGLTLTHRIAEISHAAPDQLFVPGTVKLLGDLFPCFILAGPQYDEAIRGDEKTRMEKLLAGVNLN